MANTQELSFFVPSEVVRFLRRDSPPIPHFQSFASAALFADISGYTALTEKLSTNDREGAEKVSDDLNSLFTQMVALITRHGGDVIKFAGDALFVIWSTEALSEKLETVAIRACQCGLDLLATLGNFTTSTGVLLRFRIGVGAGQTFGIHVGGERLEFLTAGDTSRQMTAAEARAKPGELVVSPETWKLVGIKCMGSEVSDGYFHVTQLHGSIRVRMADAVALPLGHASEALIQRYAPRAVVATDAAWLDELRLVTVLFVKLKNVLITSEDQLAFIQQLFVGMQSSVHRYQGTVRQFLVDDKGVVLVAAFGLPPYGHDDDAVRAVRTALEMHAFLNDLNVQSSIGVTSGRAFCGSVGSSNRKEYAIIGGIVNLSARLMAAASKEDGSLIYVDPETRAICGASYKFQERTALRLKGISEPVPVYSPIARRQASVIASQKMTRTKYGMFGRDREYEYLVGLLYFYEPFIRPVVVVGDPGVGKSKLLDEVEEFAERVGVGVIKLIADPIDSHTAYLAWKPFFLRVFEFSADMACELDFIERKVNAILSIVSPTLVSRAPLLSPVLPIVLPDSEITSQMTGQVRADNTLRVMMSVVEAYLDGRLTRQPSRGNLMVADNIQWLDESSLGLLKLFTKVHLKSKKRPLLICMSSRPPPQNSVKHPSQVIAGLSRRVKVIQLNPLGPELVEQMVLNRLDCDKIDQAVFDFITSRVQGNPFFVVELLALISDKLSFTNNRELCQFRSDVEEELSALHFESIGRLIVSRFDHLSAELQLVLKVASVFGSEFDLDALSAVFPQQISGATLQELLAQLVGLGFLSKSTVTSRYLFSNMIFADTIYDMIPVGQRRTLHSSIASEIERSNADYLEPHYAVLAYHWRRADVLPRAVEFMSKAADIALSNNANVEARRLFQELLHADPDGVHIGDTVQVAIWERKLGTVCLNLQEEAAALEHFLRALELAGHPLPEPGMPLAYAERVLSIRIFAQTSPLLCCLRKPPVKDIPQAEKDELLMLFNAYINIPHCSMVAKGSLTAQARFAALAQQFIAQRFGTSPELGLSTTTALAVFAAMGQHAKASQFEERAVALMGPINDSETLMLMGRDLAYYSLSVGDFASFYFRYRACHSIATSVAAGPIMAQLATLRGWAYLLQGQFGRAMSSFDTASLEAESIGTAGSSMQHALTGTLSEAYFGKLMVALRDGGQIWRGGNHVGFMSEERMRTAAPSSRLNIVTHKAIRAISMGSIEDGLLLINRACKLVPVCMSSRFFTFFSVYALTRVLLDLWVSSRQSVVLAEIQALTQFLVPHVKAFAEVYPVARPTCLYYAGMVHFLKGESRRASTMLRKATLAAKTLGLPYEESLARALPQRPGDLVANLEYYSANILADKNMEEPTPGDTDSGRRRGDGDDQDDDDGGGGGGGGDGDHGDNQADGHRRGEADGEDEAQNARYRSNDDKASPMGSLPQGPMADSFAPFLESAEHVSLFPKSMALNPLNPIRDARRPAT